LKISSIKDKFEELVDSLNDDKINELITTLKSDGNFKLTKRMTYMDENK
jgi:hypothetical protein